VTAKFLYRHSSVTTLTGSTAARLNWGCCLICRRRATPKFLARLFKVRVQRVMAILALKQIEAEEDRERAEEDAARLQAAQEKIIAAGSFEAAGFSLDLSAQLFPHWIPVPARNPRPSTRELAEKVEVHFRTLHSCCGRI